MQYLKEQQYKNLSEENVQGGRKKIENSFSSVRTVAQEPKLQVVENGCSGTTADRYTLQSHHFLKPTYPIKVSVRTTPATAPTLILFPLLLFLHRAFVCLEQLDEMSDALLPNVTSSQSFRGNKLALS